MKKVIIYDSNRLHTNSSITLDNQDTSTEIEYLYDYDKNTLLKTTASTGSDNLTIEWANEITFDYIKIFNHNIKDIDIYKWVIGSPSDWVLIKSESNLTSGELTIELSSEVSTTKVKFVLGVSQNGNKQIGQLILCKKKIEFDNLKISNIDFKKYKSGDEYRLIDTKLTSWYIGEKLDAKINLNNILQSEIDSLESIYDDCKSGYGVCVYLQNYNIKDFIQVDITAPINAKFGQETDLYDLILYLDEI